MGLVKGFSWALLLFLVLLYGCSKNNVSANEQKNMPGVQFFGDRYGDFLKSFEATTDGGCIMGGYTKNTANYAGQGFIRKVNSKESDEDHFYSLAWLCSKIENRTIWASLLEVNKEYTGKQPK